MDKLSSTAKVLDRIMKILRGICIGFGIVCAVLLVIGIFLPYSQYSHFLNLEEQIIDIGNIRLHLARDLAPNGSIRLPVCAILAEAMIALGLSAAGLHLMHKIFAPMADARPFDESVSVNLKKLGWLSLIAVAAYFALGGTAAMLELSMYDINQLFAADLVTDVSLVYSANLSLLLIPAVLFLLSYVFKYGEELQRQSDETL